MLLFFCGCGMTPVYEIGTVKQLEYSTSGINIQNAIWIVELDNGKVVRNGCSGCLYNEIPYEGQRIKVFIGYYK